MSGVSEPVRTARFYTSARRLPWVIGKFADWRIPFGPFNAVQIALMSIGGLVLVKSASWWWSLLGPVPVIAWIAAIFVCRRHKVGGRTPVGAALGVLARIIQPKGGRISGRAARDRRPQAFTGAFTLQALPALEVEQVAEPARSSAPWRHVAPRSARVQRVSIPASVSAPVRPLSPVQAALLAAKEQN